MSTQDEGGNYPDPLGFSPRMRSIKATRTTFARIVREFSAGEIDIASMRAYCYAFSTMLSIQKAEADLDVERRLEELEAKL